eukprot:COSAG04_NODE_10041_length_810_cov_2.900141_1_plen_32_part_10
MGQLPGGSARSPSPLCIHTRISFRGLCRTMNG